MRSPSPTITVASLLAFSLFANGCEINSEARGENQPIEESSCLDSFRAFDANGSGPAILLSQLPAGRYSHVSAEIYVDQTTNRADGGKDIARFHFLETPNSGANPRTYSAGLRCHETAGRFASSFTSVSVVTDFVKYNRADTYDFAALSYGATFQTPDLITITTGYGGDTRSATAATLANVFARNWNSGYRIVRAGGDLFVFYGIQVESGTGRTIYAKATFARTGLPPNSP